MIVLATSFCYQKKQLNNELNRNINELNKNVKEPNRNTNKPIA